MPLSAPRLLAKQSRQLLVSPLVSFSGDGPIASVRLHYRPQDSTMAWSTIVGEWGQRGAGARGDWGRRGCQVAMRGEGVEREGEERGAEGGVVASGGGWG